MTASMAPLSGLRVLDLATLYSAPLAASMLADFGADVIKVEPVEGDFFRDSAMWPVVARGKRSIAIDLRTEEGCELLRCLVERCDVVIENVPRAVMERRGLTYDRLAQRNPRLVMVSVSCFGAGGLYADLPGSGTLAEAFGGVTELTGDPDGPPMLPSVALGDAVAAMSAVIGALVACRARDVVTGAGQHVDVAMYEPILQLVAPALAGWSIDRPPPKRTGSRLANPVSVRNVFRSQDRRYLAISCSTPRHERELLECAGADLAVPRSPDEMDQLVATWIAAQSAAQTSDVLRARRIPGVLVNDLASLIADPQVVARDSVVRLDGAFGDTAFGVAPTPRLSATPGHIRSAGPLFAEHSTQVLAEVLGWSSEQIAAAAARGVVVVRAGDSSEIPAHNA